MTRSTPAMFLKGAARAARALGQRVRASVAREPVPCWTEYLRETRQRG